MRFTYSPEQLVFLKVAYRLMDLNELTEAFNCEYRLGKTSAQIKAALSNHGLTCKKSTGCNSISRLFNLEQHYFICELYKELPIHQLATAFNEHYKASITVQQLKSYTSNHKILSGRTGCFERGLIPWNTGTKGVMKVNSGSFKKGSLPANTRELGAERVCSKDGYILVKVAEKNPYTKAKTRFRHKHQVIWEKHHGKKLPKGQVITFLDGDKRNFDPKNLVAVNRNLLCRYNQNHANELPKELIPTMKSVINLKQKIHERSAELERKKQ